MTQSDLRKKLDESVDYLNDELAKIRTGRANPALIEGVKVSAYDTQMGIKELASVNTSDAQTIVISPWDPGLVKSIDKAIRESDLQLNPSVDGHVIRVVVPALTEERRKELAKIVSTKMEEVRQSIRNIRQDAMKDIDSRFEAKEISEDEKFDLKEVVEDTIKEYNKKVEDLGGEKKDSLMEI